MEGLDGGKCWQWRVIPNGQNKGLHQRVITVGATAGVMEFGGGGL